MHTFTHLFPLDMCSFHIQVALHFILFHSSGIMLQLTFPLKFKVPYTVFIHFVVRTPLWSRLSLGVCVWPKFTKWVPWPSGDSNVYLHESPSHFIQTTHKRHLFQQGILGMLVGVMKRSYPESCHLLVWNLMKISQAVNFSLCFIKINGLWLTSNHHMMLSGFA